MRELTYPVNPKKIVGIGLPLGEALTIDEPQTGVTNT
jgi:hypothetical protein